MSIRSRVSPVIRALTAPATSAELGREDEALAVFRQANRARETGAAQVGPRQALGRPQMSRLAIVLDVVVAAAVVAALAVASFSNDLPLHRSDVLDHSAPDQPTPTGTARPTSAPPPGRSVPARPVAPTTQAPTSAPPSSCSPPPHLSSPPVATGEPDLARTRVPRPRCAPTEPVAPTSARLYRDGVPDQAPSGEAPGRPGPRRPPVSEGARPSSGTDDLWRPGTGPELADRNH